MPNRTCAWAFSALAIVGSIWAGASCGQQSSESLPPSPPPPISFGDQAGPEKAQLQFEAADSSRVSAASATNSTGDAGKYIFGERKTGALAPLRPQTQSQSVSAIADPLEQPAPSHYANVRPFAAQTDEIAPSSNAAAESFSDPQVQPAALFDSQASETTAAKSALQPFAIDRTSIPESMQPTCLTEIVAATSIESRPEVIRLYWAAFAAWAKSVMVRGEAHQLAELRNPVSAVEQDLLGAAQSLAQARMIEAEMDLDAALQRLALFAPMVNGESLPLPSDLPLADEYVTNHDLWGQQFEFNPRLDQINRGLPKVLQIIQVRADAANRSRQTVSQAIQGFNQNQTPLATALEAIRICRESQQDFVRAVQRYNQDIAEYALAVAPYGQPPEQVVSMLIKQPLDRAADSPSIASATPLSRPPRISQAAATQSNALGSATNASARDVESSAPWGSVPQSKAPSSFSAQPPFASNGTLQFSEPPPKASLEGAASATQSASIAPPMTQRPKIPATGNSGAQAGGGSFSFDKR